MSDIILKESKKANLNETNDLNENESEENDESEEKVEDNITKDKKKIKMYI
jgi:hypothetical protein